MESPVEINQPFIARQELLEDISNKIVLKKISLDEAKTKHTPADLKKFWNKKGKEFKTFAKMAGLSLFFSIDSLKEVISKIDTIERAQLVAFALTDPATLDSKTTKELIRKLMPLYAEEVKDKYIDLFRTVTKPIEIIVGDLMLRQMKSEPEVYSFVVSVLYPFFYRLSKIILTDFLDNDNWTIGVEVSLHLQKQFENLANEFYSQMSLISSYIGSVPSLFRENCHLLTQGLLNTPIVSRRVQERLSKDSTLDPEKLKKDIILGLLGTYLNIYMTAPTYINFAAEFKDLFVDQKFINDNKISMVFNDERLSESLKKVIKTTKGTPSYSVLKDFIDQLEVLADASCFTKEFQTFLSRKENIEKLMSFLKDVSIKSSHEEFIAFAYFKVFVPELSQKKQDIFLTKVRTFLGILFEYPSLKISTDLIQGETIASLNFKSPIDIYKHELYCKVGKVNRKNFVELFSALSEKDVPAQGSATHSFANYLMPLPFNIDLNDRASYIEAIKKIIKKTEKSRNRKEILSRLLFASVCLEETSLLFRILKKARTEKMEIRELLTFKCDDSTLLYCAVRQGNKEIVAILCSLYKQYSIDVDQVSYCNISPLYLAASLNNSDIIELLVRYGAKINSCNGESQVTPLQAATQAGSLGAVNLILFLYEKNIQDSQESCHDIEQALKISQHTQNALIYLSLKNFKNMTRSNATTYENLFFTLKLKNEEKLQNDTFTDENPAVFYKMLFRKNSKVSITPKLEKVRSIEQELRNLFTEIVQNKKDLIHLDPVLHSNPKEVIQLLTSELVVALTKESYPYAATLKTIIQRINSIFTEFEFFRNNIIETLKSTPVPNCLFEDTQVKDLFFISLEGKKIANNCC